MYQVYCLSDLLDNIFIKVLNIGYRDHIGWGVFHIGYQISGEISGIRVHIGRSY